MEKPYSIGWRTKTKWVLLILTGILCMILLFLGYSQVKYIRTIEKNGIQTTATVVRIEKVEDSESGTSYYPYVQYQYNGETFCQKISYFGDSDTKTGDVVQITINPYAPSEILGEVREDAFVVLMLGAVLLGLGGMAAGIRTREGWCETFGIALEMIHKDLLEKAKRFHKWLGWFLGGVYMIVCGLLAGMEITRFILFAIPMLAYGIFGICKTVIAFVAILSENYTVHRDQLQSKDIYKDEDDLETYYLHYKTQTGRCYKLKVSKQTYQNTEIGAEILSVTLPGGKRPYMNIHMHDLSVQ